MAECNACGASVSPSELFCGNCGTQQIPNSPELKTVAANFGEAVEVQPETPAVIDPPVADPLVDDPPTDDPPLDDPPVAELSATLEDAPISAPVPPPIS